MIILINGRSLKTFAGMFLHSTGCSAVAFAIATGPKFDLTKEFVIISASLLLYLLTLKHGGRIVTALGGPLASTSNNAVDSLMMATILLVYGIGWIPWVAAAFYIYLGVQYFRLALRVVAARKQS